MAYGSDARETGAQHAGRGMRRGADATANLMDLLHPPSVGAGEAAFLFINVKCGSGMPDTELGQMNQVIQQISSPVFLVCTAIGSIVFNVLSHYLVRYIDRFVRTIGGMAKELWDPLALKREARNRRIQQWIEAHANGAPIAQNRALMLKVNALICFAASGILTAGLSIFDVDHNKCLIAPPAPHFFLWFITVAASGYTLAGLGYLTKSLRLERVVTRITTQDEWFNLF